jgi:AraC family transcriptional regulator
MDGSPMSATALRAITASAADCAALAPRAGVPEAASPSINFRPASLAKRQTATWRGLSGEMVRTIRREPFESDYCGPSHLLIAYERAKRHEGESIVDGLPRSTLHDLTHKLVFVPAGCGFRDRQEPRVLMRAIYLHLDPHSALMRQAAEGQAEPAPRLFFESAALWQTALKLKTLIEAGPSASRLYADALTVVLSHELLDGDARTAEPPTRGGLAGWQRRAVTHYLEENLAEQISLAKLAALAQLSPYHFSHAFKQSFGVPPHRYHTGRRIDRAKTLLGKPTLSVTDIALEIGFSNTSSFSAAFRKFAGRTPSAYRRCLV